MGSKGDQYMQMQVCGCRTFNSSRQCSDCKCTLLISAYRAVSTQPPVFRTRPRPRLPSSPRPQQSAFVRMDDDKPILHIFDLGVALDLFGIRSDDDDRASVDNLNGPTILRISWDIGPYHCRTSGYRCPPRKIPGGHIATDGGGWPGQFTSLRGCGIAYVLSQCMHHGFHAPSRSEQQPQLWASESAGSPRPVG